MISVICPHCGNAICILAQPCMDELIKYGRGLCKCYECKKHFVIYNGKTQIEAKEVLALKAIVAVDKNWGIGKDNELLFHIPEDMKFFKRTTINNVVVMGRKTYESLPNGALKDRDNIVLTNTKKYVQKHPEVLSGNMEYVNGMINLFEKQSVQDIYIIGGDSVYKLFLDRLEEIFVTIYDKEFEANKFFPNLFEDDRFKMSEIIFKGTHEGNEYKITRWIRVKD